ncbi:MAG: MBL fold metallo-hydrolase [Clostridia bacterium]|nr:MBL fold metallo-hydrolase [Clostridia bacterium]
MGQFLMAYMPKGAEPTTATYLNLLATLDEKNISVVDVKPGTAYALGEAKITILGPVKDSEDKNEQSVVCRVTHGSQRLLFTGDAGREAENNLLEAGVDLRADLLKVGHHGSSSSSTADFLKAVGAKIGIISCGVDNDYGHPHKEVLERMKKQGVTLYRTDRDGTVKVISDGKSLKIETEG